MSNFSIKELTASSVAVQKGISNTPSVQEVENLMYTISQLEAIRSLLGDCSMLVSSGYRSKALNAAVGGVATSAHTTGLAVDFTAPKYGTPKDIVAKLYNSSIPYDQLILEYPDNPNKGWVHIGFSAKGKSFRRETLVKMNGKPYTQYKQ